MGYIGVKKKIPEYVFKFTGVLNGGERELD